MEFEGIPNKQRNPKGSPIHYTLYTLLLPPHKRKEGSLISNLKPGAIQSANAGTPKYRLLHNGHLALVSQVYHLYHLFLPCIFFYSFRATPRKARNSLVLQRILMHSARGPGGRVAVPCGCFVRLLRAAVSCGRFVWLLRLGFY